MKGDMVIVRPSDIRLVFFVGVLVGILLLISVAVGYVWLAPNFHVREGNHPKQYQGIPY